MSDRGSVKEPMKRVSNKPRGRPRGARLTGRLASAVAPDVEAAFRRIARERGTDVSDIVREAAQYYLATYKGGLA